MEAKVGGEKGRKGREGREGRGRGGEREKGRVGSN